MRNTALLPLLFSARRWLRAAFLVFLTLAISSTSATAQDSSKRSELKKKREANQEQIEQTEAQVDYLTASVEDSLRAIGTVSEQRDRAQVAVDSAKVAVADAERRQAQAIARIAELEELEAQTEALLRQSAIAAFTSHQGPNSEQTALGDDPWNNARNNALRGFVNQNTEDLLDSFRAQEAELSALKETANAALAEVELLRNERLAIQYSLEAAYSREQDALDELDNRLDQRLEEAAFLEQIDAELARQIRVEEKRIADAIAAAKRRARRVSVPKNAPVDLTTVAGPVMDIVVNVSLADNLAGFLAAMEQAGFPLGGYGYRTNARQIQLRRHHCGTSDFAVYEMSASRCRPPTARPGRSQHEVGLAVDFTYRGRIVSSRNSAVFKAMQRIAPQYGLINLPSEPWHWSTTGR